MPDETKLILVDQIEPLIHEIRGYRPDCKRRSRNA